MEKKEKKKKHLQQQREHGKQPEQPSQNSFSAINFWNQCENFVRCIFITKNYHEIYNKLECRVQKRITKKPLNNTQNEWLIVTLE